MKLPSLYLLLFPTHSVLSPGGVGPALEGVRFLSRGNVCPLPPAPPPSPDTENFRSIRVCADVVSVEKFRKVFPRKKPSFSQFSWPPAREGAHSATEEEGKVVGVGG